MKSLKSLFISTFISLAVFTTGMALWQLFTGGGWPWAVLLLTCVPSVGFFSYLFVLKPARTSENLPTVFWPTLLGTLAVISLALAGQACVVMTADCLPVLFCDRQGTRVGVAHAGWRGLVEGVLEATIERLGDDPGELMAWLGPAISNAQFEVGPEVRDAFIADLPEADDAFEASPYRLGHYMGDLYKLARLRLERAGVGHVSGGHFCTASESRFYSHRRDDGVTGRLATVIWLR